MKKSIVSILVCVGVGCSSAPADEPAKLSGRWNMVYTLADIGDGKGTWQPADSKNMRTIEFTASGEFVDSHNHIRQKYILQDSAHLQIVPIGQEMPYLLTIVQLTTDTLELRPSCIEACGEKFVRAKK